MPVPPTIRRLVTQAGGLPLPGVLAETDGPCQGARFHSPRPLIVREYLVRDNSLVEVTSVVAPSDAVWLCATCASNVEVLVTLLRLHGALPWSARREFGNAVRSIAERGWSTKEPVA